MTILVQLGKYIMIFLIALYTFQCYTVFRYRTEKKQKRIYRRQNVLMYLNHFVAFSILTLASKEYWLVIFYAAQVLYFAATLLIFNFAYPKASRLIVNNMCMLLSIGFIIITRLNTDKALMQFKIVVFATVIGLLIPVIIRKITFLKKLKWLYGAAGFALLLALSLFEKVEGANLVLKVGSFSVQPTEFVKIIFVFFIAAMLYKNTSFSNVVFTTMLAGVFVLLLVYYTDLGAALIFFVAFLIILYVATHKVGYLLAGLGGGSIAAVIAFYMFSHVQVRVEAWLDPFAQYETGGYQIAQSLFAIGTGGWFGMGLYQGAPTTIPVAAEDFVFSAIAEELGGIYALCLILICMSCFLMFVNISFQIKDVFYKLVALGLGTMYGFQVFLTIGGGLKFIPLTGVTLPLVSYGGSSVLSTLIMFMIIQGLYILREDEDENLERKRSEHKSEGKRSKEEAQPLSAQSQKKKNKKQKQN